MNQTEAILKEVDSLSESQDETRECLNVLRDLHLLYNTVASSFSYVVTSAISHEAFYFKSSVEAGVVQLNKYNLQRQKRELATAGVDAAALDIYTLVRRRASQIIKRSPLDRRKMERLLCSFLEGAIK